jgi:hypothetical protein
MKQLLVLIAIAGLLLSAAVAGLNYNASKSNTGHFAISYPTGVTKAQVSAILSDLEKLGKAPDEAAVQGMLKSHAVSAALAKKIVIEPGNGGATILLLADPADEAAARGALKSAASPK